MRKGLFSFLLFFVTSFFLKAGNEHIHNDPSFIKFSENKGQWEDHIQFKADIPSGNLFLEKDAFVYVFHDDEDMNRLHNMYHGQVANLKPEDYIIRGHCMKVNFLQANNVVVLDGEQKTSDYENYFLGDDPEKWASNVNKFQHINYNNLYPGIDLQLYGQYDNLKYDLIVAPGAATSQIQLHYEGVENIRLRHGALHIKTSVNKIVEQKPYAYQMVNGEEVPVTCNFVLEDEVLTFEFPDGYNEELELVIDPVLIFSSYSGSTRDNWGYTATYDNAGNLYGGGVVFNGAPGRTYPTVGAFQSAYNGGQTDISISKFASDGSTLLYSTYLGGNDNESPHSLVVNNSNELIVYGTTGSTDYPTSITAFDRSFNGGSSFSATSSVSYTNGSDIIVTKFNAAGNALLASTFIGGVDNDGLNESTALVKNYGDEFRGEVFVDGSDNIYIASVTSSSSDFPTANAVQPNFGGGAQDGCVFKLNPTMTTLLWSTFLGGGGNDAAYSIQLDGSGNALIAGGTTSSDFTTTSPVLHETQRGGVDGFISKISAIGDSLLASTYIGTAAFDQNYFIQLDAQDNVYVVGQTEGVYPVFPSTVFSQPNGGQYIHKLSSNLDTTIFSMTFGTNRPAEVDITLSAFLVNDCDHIYVSGWGGGANVFTNVLPNSSTNNLLTTAGAHKATTDGNDFYLLTLAEDADSVIYSTFFGGTSSALLQGEHADGGTSRFDKKGIIYQAVCAGCQGTNVFPTSSGVWSNTNGSANCNLGVIKFDLSKPFSSIELSSPPYICIPDSVYFGNQSIGTDFFWDFGDGTTSTAYEPVHYYKDTGTFVVSLIVSDSALCVTTDTSFVVMRGVPRPKAEISAITPICEGDSIQLISSGGTTRQWFPATGLSSDTIHSPFAFPDTTTTYRLIVMDSCSSDTSYIKVEVFQDETFVMQDTGLCLGNSIKLLASGGIKYTWSPSFSLNSPDGSDPIASPTSTTTYQIEIEDINGCIWTDTILVEVDSGIPNPQVSNDTILCLGQTTQLIASGGATYKWQPSTGLSDSTIFNPVVDISESTVYTVFVTNACGTGTETVEVEIDRVIITSVGDSIACIGEPAFLALTGADFYEWEPAEVLNRPDIQNPKAIIFEPTQFFIKATNVRGCETDTTFLLDLREPPFLDAGNDIVLNWGSSTLLKPLGEGRFFWQPLFDLSCEYCKNPLAKPEETRIYYVTLQDEFGCETKDSLTIFVTGEVYLPNAFTPNGDGINDAFGALTRELQEFELSIFNRWGELVFYSESSQSFWDGNFKGKKAPNGTYVWQVRYVENSGVAGEKVGHVNLIR